MRIWSVLFAFVQSLVAVVISGCCACSECAPPFAQTCPSPCAQPCPPSCSAPDSCRPFDEIRTALGSWFACKSDCDAESAPGGKVNKCRGKTPTYMPLRRPRFHAIPTHDVLLDGGTGSFTPLASHLILPLPAEPDYVDEFPRRELKSENVAPVGDPQQPD